MCIIEKQSLWVGFDLGNEDSQICFYDETLFEPHSVSLSEEEERYFLPTVLAAKKEEGQWYFGEEAIALSKDGKAELLKDFVSKIEKEEPILYYGVELKGEDVLKRYFIKCFHLLTLKFPDSTIGALGISIAHKEKALVTAIYSALEQLGLKKDRVCVMSRQESYVYYALRQKKELWQNDVGLFDFSRDGLTFSRIYMNKRTTPITVGIESVNFSELLNFEMLSEREETELSYLLDEVTKQALHKKIVSTIYVTGIGFSGNWHQSVLEGLCVGRRVFLGQNLYAQGACYGALELFGKSKLDDYLLLNEEMVLVNISMKVFHDTKNVPFYFVKAGTMWFDVSKTIEVIPDNETELELEIFDLMTQHKKTFFLHIDQLEGRPNRTTVLEVTLKFLEPKTCVLQVKDKGFGNMFPSTNRIWEKEIHL